MRRHVGVYDYRGEDVSSPVFHGFSVALGAISD